MTAVTRTANPFRVGARYEHRPQALADLTAMDLIGPGSVLIREDATLWDALERFLTHHTRHLVVIDHHRRYRRLLSHRHLLGQVPLDARALQHSHVRDPRHLDRPALPPGAGLTAVAQSLHEYEVDAAPVIEPGGRLLGAATRAGVVRAVAEHGPVPVDGDRWEETRSR